MTFQSNIAAEGLGKAVGDELPPGTVLCNGQYVIEQFLNAGGFGVTYQARDSLDRKVVIKECFPNAMCCRAGQSVRLRSRSMEPDFRKVVELFQKEARALARLQHPSIVGVHQIFEGNNTAYMALDFVAGLDLFDLMEQHRSYLTPDVVKSVLISLLKALTYVHESGILHRDISPDNILLDANGAPVLIDFGASRQGTTHSRILTRVHTVKDGYSPQEFYFEGSTQSQSSDLYALAATIVHMITGEAPPSSSFRLAAVSEKNPDPYQPLSGRYADYPVDFLAAVDACMSLFAKDRIPTAKAWLDLIRGQGPQGAPETPPPAMDAQIDDQIAKLVATCNAEIAKGVASKPKAKPVKEVAVDQDAARIAAEREYWAILNEDPSNFARPARPLSSVPEQPACNAIERVRKRAEEAAKSTSEQMKAAKKEELSSFSLSSLLPWN